ncbi:MAG: 50S ribosomal protein L24e [Candidatus Altiarchaeota archaeon]
MDCSFCGFEISSGQEKIFVNKKGKALYFCSSKCEKNLLKLGRDPRKLNWTKKYEKGKTPPQNPPKVKPKKEKPKKSEKKEDKPVEKKAEKKKTKAEKPKKEDKAKTAKVKKTGKKQKKDEDSGSDKT